MARHPADGSENDNVNANASGLLAEVEALRHRLAALEARLPENAPKEPPRRQLREVGRNTDTAAVDLQKLDMLIRLAGTQDQTERTFLTGLHFILLQPT